MRSKRLSGVQAIVLLSVRVIPVGLSAQEQNAHHHYVLIDLGTFGGPSAVLENDCAIGGGGTCGVLNNQGSVVSQADTAVSNPNYLNSNPLLPPFTVPGDPFIFHAFQWRDGALQDLGSLQGGYNSFAQSISPRGWIAGASENGAFDPLTGWPEVHATLWKSGGGNITDLGTLEGGFESEAFSVNDHAQVVGSALNTIPDPFGFGTQLRAFFWQNGVMQDLGTLGTGNDAQAYWVNESGQVAGVSFTNTTPNSVTGIPTQDPFLWENGTMTDVGTLGGNFGLPNAINNRGQVVGVSNIAGDVNAHAFLWDKGKLRDLGTLDGASPPGSTALWINDGGEVVGGSYTASPFSPFHAVLWNNGTITDLGTVDGDMCSGSLGVNSKGQVVGFSSIDCVENSHAFMWQHGQLIDLNIFNHSGSGLDQLLLAYNINDGGEIVGLGVPPGVDPADVFTLGHTFVLIPCDDAEVGVDGCQEGTDSVSTAPRLSPVSHRILGGARGPSLPHRTSRFHFRAPTAAESKEQQSSTQSVRGNVAEDLLRDRTFPCRTCTGGYCELNSNNTLNGVCIGQGSIPNQCSSKSNPTQCPVGKSAIAPGNLICGIGEFARVDGARRCTD